MPGFKKTLQMHFCLFIFKTKDILDFWKRDFSWNKDCKGKVNIDIPYSLLDTPTNTFKCVLYITIDHETNSRFLYICPIISYSDFFLFLPRRRSIFQCLKASWLLSVTVHPLRNVSYSWAMENLVAKMCLQSRSWSSKEEHLGIFLRMGKTR